MNIYGTKGKMIRGEVLESLNCPSCGNKTHRSFGVLRYFHLYEFRCFPSRKSRHRVYQLPMDSPGQADS
jgi:hypothetical protein